MFVDLEVCDADRRFIEKEYKKRKERTKNAEDQSHRKERRKEGKKKLKCNKRSHNKE